MIKTYKFRLYANKQQASLLKQHAGNSRFTWNKLVEFSYHFKQETNKYPSWSKISHEIIKLKEEYDFLKLSHSQPLQVNALRLSRAITNAFKPETMAKRKERIAQACRETDLSKRGKKLKNAFEFAFPKFHKKSDNSDSIYYPQNIKSFKIKKSKIFFAKLGWFNFKKHRRIEGSPRAVTITQDGNQWFVSIACEASKETPMPKPLEQSNVIGIDVGLKTFATFSDDTTIENPRTLKKYQDQIDLENQRLDKKQTTEVTLPSGRTIKKNSKRREKQCLKLHRLHRKIRNIRKDFIHKLTHHIITTYDGVALETLDIQTMMKNNPSSVNRAISDVSWYGFSKQLEYKSEWYGKHFVKIDTFEPSTQRCNKCKNIAKLSIDERVYKCEFCGNVDDRDLNAAKNIREEGLRLLREKYNRTNTAGTAATSVRDASARRSVSEGTKKREKRLAIVE